MNYIFLDNGFEEIEAITTIDLLRRANIALTTVSVTGVESVLGAHNIAVKQINSLLTLTFRMQKCLFCLVEQPNYTSVNRSVTYSWRTITKINLLRLFVLRLLS